MKRAAGWLQGIFPPVLHFAAVRNSQLSAGIPARYPFALEAENGLREKGREGFAPLVRICYFGFLGSFLSSFLPFFFIAGSFSCEARLRRRVSRSGHDINSMGARVKRKCVVGGFIYVAGFLRVLPAGAGCLAGAKKSSRRPLQKRKQKTVRGSAGAGDGVIAFASENGEAVAADAAFDGMVVFGAVVAAGIVAQGVLIAGLFGHPGVQGFEVIPFRGVENVPAGIVG